MAYVENVVLSDLLFIKKFPIIWLFFIYTLFFFFKKKTSINSKLVFIYELSILSFFFIFIIFYFFSNIFLNHIEPTIGYSSYLVFKYNEPLYSLINNDVFSLLYGPLLYFFNYLGIVLFNLNSLGIKFFGLLSSFLGLLIFSVVINKETNLKLATICITYLILNSALFEHAFFWNRPDSYLLLMVAIAISTLYIKNSKYGLFLFFIIVGISLNLKIHSIFYFVPIIYFFYLKGAINLQNILNGICLCLVIFLIPFVPKNISLNEYFSLLANMTKHKFAIEIFLLNIQYLFFFSACLLVNKANILNNKIQYFILFASSIFVLIIASKEGSGPYHLLPMLLIFIYCGILQYKTLINKRVFDRLFLSILLVTSIYFYPKVILVTKYLFFNESRIKEIIVEIENIQKKYTNISIGYGDESDYQDTFYKFNSLKNDNYFLIEASSLMDIKESGLKINKHTINSIKSCKIDFILIPKGKKPFTMRSYYSSKKELFDEEFRIVFLDNYNLIDTYNKFDIYGCKR